MATGGFNSAAQSSIDENYKQGDYERMKLQEAQPKIYAPVMAQYAKANDALLKSYNESGLTAATDRAYNQNVALSETAMQTMDELKRYIGINAPGEAGFTGDQLTQHIMNSPEYKARFDVGKQAMERSQAAKGGLLGGNALIEAQKYGQNLAGDVYQNQIANLGSIFGMTSPYIDGQVNAAAQKQQLSKGYLDSQLATKYGDILYESTNATRNASYQMGQIEAQGRNQLANTSLAGQNAYDIAGLSGGIGLKQAGLSSGVAALSQQAAARSNAASNKSNASYGYLSQAQQAYNEQVKSQMGNMAGYLQYV